MVGPIQIRYTPTDRELGLALVEEHFRAHRWGLFRVAAGPTLIAVGFVLRATATEDAQRGLGMFFIFYGIYYALRPLLVAAFRIRERRRTDTGGATELTLDDAGVRVESPGATTKVRWDSVLSAGRRASYFWIEVRGNVRFFVPARAVADAPALEARLRDHGKWKS